MQVTAEKTENVVKDRLRVKTANRQRGSMSLMQMNKRWKCGSTFANDFRTA